ncbi:hypothetical protein N7474_005095 [Penicillium riverlandense]|uniref:uncharacterized protein n=1 Tax=Penicillium riverlandense TaxID=1903569 RepID=UPI00254973AA|nr:uncharacterized protein N7474_005095 [Penicillium riverlandense]KAJ5819504.1 hypothetical protein N7474_005095 [Penicillium riverlandense]
MLERKIGFLEDTLHLKGPVSRHYFLISLPSRFSATTALDPEFAPCSTETTRDDIPRHIYSDIFTGEVSQSLIGQTGLPRDPWDMDLPLGLSFSQLSDLLVQNDADPFAVQTTASSSHWVPSMAVTKVEVRPGFWEGVIVVLLAKNSHRSKAPNDLLKERQIVHWFVRYWDTLVNKKKVPETSVPVHVEVESERVTGVSCDMSLLRGRLRRRTRRLSKGTGTPVYQIANLASIPHVLSSGEDFLNNPNRGRLRRRMRRLDTSGAPSITVSTKTLRCPATSTTFFQRLPGTFAREWNLNSQILGKKAAALLRNQINIAISLRSIPLQSSDGEGDFSLWKGLKPLLKLTPYPYSVPSSKGGHECNKYVWLQQKEDPHLVVPSGCKNRAIVALVEDYVGLVDSSFEEFESLRYAYISSITAEQSVPGLHAALSLDSYWKHLSFLVMGNSRSRYLPYAKGYGISHYRPRVPRKNFRYGVYNVDTLDKTASAPSWRAAWSFQVCSRTPRVPEIFKA